MFCNLSHRIANVLQFVAPHSLTFTILKTVLPRLSDVVATAARARCGATHDARRDTINNLSSLVYLLTMGGGGWYYVPKVRYRAGLCCGNEIGRVDEWMIQVSFNGNHEPLESSCSSHIRF